MPKRTSRGSSPNYKRARKDNAVLYQDILRPASTLFKLRLIDEVTKYPILKSMGSKENKESCYDAWAQIVDSIQEDWVVTSTTVKELIDYCRRTWYNLKRAYSRFQTGETSGLPPVIGPMRALFGEIDKSADENESNDSSDENNDLNDSSDENNDLNDSSDENNDSNNSSDENNELNNSSEVGSVTAESAEEIMRPTTNNVAVTKRKSRRPPDDFKLKLIAEVKKYPSLCESLEVEVDRHVGAWEEITEALQLDTAYKDASNKKRRQSVRSAVGGNDPCVPDERGSRELQTGAPVTEAPPADADENNSMNNSSEDGSVAAEDILRPTTNNQPRQSSIPQQAATPGNPRSIGARSTERAVSFAIVDHLFDSLHSPAAKTDICNLLIKAVLKYQPNVLSEIVEYGASQPDLFNVDWSGLPVPEDLCREIWRRDAEEKLRKVYKIRSSKRHAKNGKKQTSDSVGI